MAIPLMLMVLLTIGSFMLIIGITCTRRARRMRCGRPAEAEAPRIATHDCRACGHENVAAARFCSQCGREIAPWNSGTNPSEGE